METKLPNENKAVSVGTAYEKSNAPDKGDPRLDGPYLDDLRSAQEDEYRRQREAGISQVRDEKLQEKKDIFYGERAESQKQLDDSRYYEEGSSDAAVEAYVAKLPGHREDVTEKKPSAEKKSSSVAKSRRKAAKKK